MCKQIEYETYKDLVHKSKAKYTSNLKKIRVYFICNTKHDRLYKVRPAVDKRLTNVPLLSVHPSVFSLKFILLVLFLAELNVLDSWREDLGSTFLDTKIKDKMHALVGSDFPP